MKKSVIEIQRKKKEILPKRKVTVLEVTTPDLSPLIIEQLKDLKVISEADALNMQPGASITTKLGSDIPPDQIEALRRKQRVLAIVEFGKNFKPSEENIHIESETVATISDGTGTSFVMFYSLNSYEPPMASCESLKKVNISQQNMQ